MSSTTGYSLLSYGEMVACEPRMSTYADALRKAVTPGCTVIDIGAGPGIFSLLACQYGAGTVVAIEPDSSAELIREFAKDNGYAERITVFRGLSTDFNALSKADVIISDIRGCLPLFESHIATIVDARERLLAPDGILIPARDHLRIALVEAPADYPAYEAPWHRNSFGLDLSKGRRYADNSSKKVNLTADRLLSEPADLATLDYYTIEQADLTAGLEIKVERRGTARGLLVWFDAELAPGIGYSNSPDAPPQIYGQTFLPLDGHIEVLAGDRAAVTFTANLIDGSYVWGWSGEILRDQKPILGFRHSTFRSRILSPQSLEPRASTFIPPQSSVHAIDRVCLTLIDGKRSLSDMAAELSTQFPDTFSNKTEALNYVANLTARYR
jgi:protein arginine N-methyltransferase 1